MKFDNVRAYARPPVSHRAAYRDGRQTGFGIAPCHHGEWLQGEFQDGLLSVPALVTVPCPLFRSRATFVITPRASSINVHPGTHLKALRAARLTLEWLGQRHLGGRLSVQSPAPVGFGFGSSTADCLSAVRAVASAFGRILPAEIEARLTIKAEGASDATMFDATRPVLFSQCHGRVLEAFYPAWPKMGLLGFCTSADANGIDTSSIQRPGYTPAEHREFARLRAGVRRGIERQSVEMLGEIAGRSAEINHRYFPIPHFSELQALVRKVGAAGMQVAHTGCIAGFVFRDDAASEELILEAQKGLSAVGLVKTWRFRIGRNRARTPNRGRERLELGIRPRSSPGAMLFPAAWPDASRRDAPAEILI